MCLVFQESLMTRDMAEALTQWEQLNPAQGDVPEKHRNLVLLGKDGSLSPCEFTQCGHLLSQYLGALRFLDSKSLNSRET